jgi:hypothetical protein
MYPGARNLAPDKIDRQGSREVRRRMGLWGKTPVPERRL